MSTPLPHPTSTGNPTGPRPMEMRARNPVQRFLDWLERLPLVVGMLFFPIVLILFAIAIMINKFKSQKENETQ